MEGVDTVDGRRVEPGALHLAEDARVVAFRPGGSGDSLSTVVGRMTTLTREGGEVRGSGWLDTSLLQDDRRTFPCGLEMRISQGRPTPTGYVIMKGEVVGLTLYLNDQAQPAWPGCEITLGPSDGE